MLPGGIRLVVDTYVSTVWLDRPEVRNAQTFATWASLAQVPATLPGTTRVVLIRGAGPDFSAGLDLRMLQPGGWGSEGEFADLVTGDDASIASRIAGFQRGFTCWPVLDAVVIAVVQGRAIGAGFQLALAADLRVLTDDAALRMAEVTLGLVPDLGGTQRLIELVGPARALELCLTGRTVEATEADRLGLVNRMVSTKDQQIGVEELVENILAQPAAAVRAGKLLLAGSSKRTPAEQLEAERATQVPLLRGIASGS